MQTKVFEIRDRNTFIPVLAVRVLPETKPEFYLARRCGYDPAGTSILVTRLEGNDKATADAYAWNDRTMQSAHLHIEKHWRELDNGAVIDVEFILGETREPKRSERHNDYAEVL